MKTAVEIPPTPLLQMGCAEMGVRPISLQPGPLSRSDLIASAATKLAEAARRIEALEAKVRALSAKPRSGMAE